MGRYLTITGSGRTEAGFRKSTVKREITIGPNAIKFITIAVFAILALVYLTQSTAGANRSVKVQEITDQKAALEVQKEQLEVEKYRLQSLSQIQGSVPTAQQPMQPVSAVDHLPASAVGIARN